MAANAYSVQRILIKENADLVRTKTLSTSSHLSYPFCKYLIEVTEITLPYAYKWLNNQRQYRFKQFMFRSWNVFVYNNATQTYWLDNWMLNDCNKLKRCAHE